MIIGLYEGSKSKDQAEHDGFEVYSISEAVKKISTYQFMYSRSFNEKSLQRRYKR